MTTDNASALAVIENPNIMDPDRTIGRGRIVAQSQVIAVLLESSTFASNSLYVEGCSTYYGATQQGVASALNIANTIPVLLLSYDVEATNPLQNASMGVELEHVYEMYVEIGGITSATSIRRGTYYRYTISSSLDSDSVYGLYAFDGSNNQIKSGIFTNMDFTDNSVFDKGYGESLLDGQSTSAVSVMIDDLDTIDISVMQIDFFGDSADVNQDGYVNNIDRDMAQSASDSEDIPGESMYLPQVDYDLNEVMDDNDLWEFKRILFDTEPVCEYRSDTNNDGMVVPGDITAWLALFNTGSPFADSNNDGAVVPSDFTAFLAEYSSCTTP